MHNPESVLENETHKILSNFEIQTDHQTTRPIDSQQQQQQQQRICRIVNIGIPIDYRVKLKKSEKKDKYLDLARERKKLWNMKVTVILVMDGALGTITK